MTSIINPELKNLIYDIICFTDEVNASGGRVQRSTFKKEHFRSAQSVKEKILAQLNLLLSDGTSVLVKEYKPSDEIQAVGERHTPEAQIELTDNELKTIKYYYAERDEVMSVSLSAYDEFVQLIGAS